MDNYKIVIFSNTNAQNELLIALLSNEAFDSFEEVDDNTLKAYILSDNFDIENMQHLLPDSPNFEAIEFDVQDLPNKNWNEEWEKNFQAIHIGNKCTVRAPFHEKNDAEFDLVIEPKMAFGTGHHATTEMVLSLMLEEDFTNKTVLDFGCGTGILSLLAEKKGASAIDANDIEEPAYINTVENAKLNNCVKITALHGDIQVVPDKTYDIILANVTANILEDNLEKLNQHLKASGQIYLSGILPEQQTKIEAIASSLELTKLSDKAQNNWIALHYQKA